MLNSYLVYHNFSVSGNAHIFHYLLAEGQSYTDQSIPWVQTEALKGAKYI